MSATQLIVYLNWAVFLLLFVRVLTQAIRRPWRINIDIALLFSAPALIALFSIAVRLGILPQTPWMRNATSTALLLIGVLLFRLVDDFVIVNARLRQAVSALMLLLTAVVALTPPPQPRAMFLVAFLALVVLLLYGAAAFLRAARMVSGVTRRRMQVVALGSLLLASTFLISLPTLLVPSLRDLVVLVADSLALASGICYFVGFSPPQILRRAWQEPELRAFLGRAAQLPRHPETATIVAELERGAANALGAPLAAVGLWHEDTQRLHFDVGGRALTLAPGAAGLLDAVWQAQQPAFIDHSVRSDPTIAALAPELPAAAALVAPITAGETRLGVLLVLAARVPIFAVADLALVQLLADQAAVILESRALIDEAARVRAAAQMTHLREDFLAAAAHDLKTPLTGLLGRAELMARRATRNPDAPADLASIQVVIREGKRLRRLMEDLLDASRVEQGQLVHHRSVVDLVALAHTVCTNHDSPLHECRVIAAEPVIGMYDAVRIEQLLENLVENAIKYSPSGGLIEITIQQIEGQVRLSVADQGIGIPEADLPYVFERFRRAANAEIQRFSGSGLGLFICRGIVEQHGGTISVSSRPGHGTTFLVTLPFEPAPVAEAAVPASLDLGVVPPV